MQQVEELQAFLDGALADRPHIRVLEAGCGSASRVTFRQPKTMIGIDISPIQLKNNTVLDEKILGDLETYVFKAEDFDIVLCWDVLEHLKKPDKALASMYAALRPGGLMMLKSPNLHSIKGLVTKWTPLWLHRVIYRHILGWRGFELHEGIGPFKTYLRYDSSPRGIRRFARANGLEVCFSRTFDVTSVWPAEKRVFRNMYGAFSGFCRWLSFGTLGESDYIIVLRRARAA